MQSRRFLTWVVAGALLLAGAGLSLPHHARAADADAQKASEKPAEKPAEAPDNAICLGCHGNEGFGAPGTDGKMRNLYVVPDKFGKSVHAKQACVGCHQDIVDIPHKPVAERKVGCVQCHQDLWAKAQKEGKTKEFARLGVVVEQIDKYMGSIHARPSRADQSRTNATCYNCHDAHYVYKKGSPERAEWHISIPNACGTCHTKERAEYEKSVHGDEVIWKRNGKAAVCSDCHTTHDVASPKLDSARLVITQNCGNCHAESFKSYTGTYHGQVNKLGYAYTAKCYNCHGSHGIQRTADPQSKVHVDNRLATCKQCHQDATAGFVTFQPHGHPGDFSRYPEIWLAFQFMLGLLAGTFAFFWTHTALWFYREYQDRKARKGRPHVVGVDIPQGRESKYFRRFSPWWRLGHLLFAVSLMMLTLTGMTVFYADSAWAPVIVRFLGGPQAAGLIHRFFAVVFAAVFIIHLIVMMFSIGKQARTFNWFGPNSLIPNLQDLTDIIAMFKWFLGQGPRPVFDRWTYWEKFDYWAPFWGVTIIGVSGVMLWFPAVFAKFLPGWVFNVATIFHGEEALLAALFLFTVHFFNNHFRPDKFPLDVVMFTGAVPLEEFAREHTVQYKRLLESGELDKHLVDAPSAPMTRGSRILGFTLIAFGLILLAMVVTGFLTRIF